MNLLNNMENIENLESAQAKIGPQDWTGADNLIKSAETNIQKGLRITERLL